MIGGGLVFELPSAPVYVVQYALGVDFGSREDDRRLPETRSTWIWVAGCIFKVHSLRRG